MAWQAATIQGGSGILGGTISGLFNNYSVKKQNQAQAKYQQKEFDNNKDMWNLANHYNAPEQQMERLKSAGLNTNLVYGNGSVVGNTSTQTPKYQAPNIQRQPLEQLNPLDKLGAFYDLQQKSAQVDLLQSTAKVKENEAQWIDQKNREDVVHQLLNNRKIEQLLNVTDYGKKGAAGLAKQDWEESPYMKGFQAQVRSTEQQNQLRNLELEFHKEFGSKGGTNALLQLIKMFK